MRAATKLPLTVKIRTSGSQDDNAYIDAAKVIQDSGADALIVHGRHWRDGYEIKNNNAQISLVKKNLSIPVIANGDIDSLEELNKCFEETGADGAMIGRGAIGRPWIFSELLGTFEGVSFREQLQCFNQHIAELIMLEKSEYIALMQARRFLKHYFINEIPKDDLTYFYQFDTLNELIASIEKYEAKK
jgi:tRNA-dihydrouridine synthase